MKKICLMLLTLAIVLTLSACTPDTDTDNSAQLQGACSHGYYEVCPPNAQWTGESMTITVNGEPRACLKCTVVCPQGYVPQLPQCGAKTIETLPSGTVDCYRCV
ncbi:hypothetical protein GF342_00750 [Candidatus Woesearchaeota archaeon]|nr:hypothetical protein [Candidatus Woesearchaeota archaeon]